MSSSNLESRVEAIEAIVSKEGQGIDDALAGFCLVSQVQAQIIGDFVHDLGESLHEFTGSMSQVYQAFGGKIDEDSDEDSDILSDDEPVPDAPALTVIPGGNHGDTGSEV